MPILTRNKFLQGAEAAVEGQLLPQTKDDYKRIVVAGMQAALHEGPRGPKLAALKNSPDVVKDAATGAVSMVLLLLQQANGQMPVEAMIPASTTLMIQALDFAEKAKLIKVGPEELSRGVTLQGNIWLHFGKVTPNRLQAMASKTHQIMQDPTQMEMVNRKAGVVKDPRVSTPTLGGPDGA